LLANGYGIFRRDHRGAPRGPYCLVGTCFECLVEVVGASRGPDPSMPHRVRACLTPASPLLDVHAASAAVKFE
jgi:sarcosine oxidase subunit alpha